MTINGKLDKRALPDPEFNTSENYLAPQTELETELCGIWSSVLGLEQVGITDHFFRIGGDSILSIQVSGRIRDLGYSCLVKDLFEYPTIKKLAFHLQDASINKINIQTESGPLTGAFSYLPIQQWFFGFAKIIHFKKHYNLLFLTLNFTIALKCAVV